MMRKTIEQTLKLMFYNGRALFLFEFIYRFIGVVIIYPIAKIIFQYSITVSKYTYITNEVFLDYLTIPSTLFFISILIF
ncbi:MAG: hypothetical protein CVV58_06930, partial [Tenericutes bacterium HGW-Tenericutes-3]